MTEIRLTYVTVKESTPDTVVYTQTASYSGEYVAATGVLMFGAGLLTAANRATPYGTVSGGRVYNPYTGDSAAGVHVSTAYGSAGRAAAYNPVTGKAAAGGYVSGERGTVAGGRTNQGSGAVAWDTKAGQGAVVKTKNDNVYAARNGNVYKKDSDGNWSSNAGSGWKPVEPARPTPTAKTAPQRPTTQPQPPSVQPRTTNRQSLDSMARSRERGSAQTQRAQSFQRSAPSRSGGGGSRRR